MKFLHKKDQNSATINNSIGQNANSEEQKTPIKPALLNWGNSRNLQITTLSVTAFLVTCYDSGVALYKIFMLPFEKQAIVIILCLVLLLTITGGWMFYWLRCLRPKMTAGPKNPPLLVVTFILIAGLITAVYTKLCWYATIYQIVQMVISIIIWMLWFGGWTFIEQYYKYRSSKTRLSFIEWCNSPIH